MRNGLIVDKYGTKRYYLNDFLHREDGPAIEWSNGDKEWRTYDQFHRKDGPAIEYSNGDKSYWVNGKLHREDGPARDWDGEKEFWINGRLFLSEENYWKEIERIKSLNFILSSIKKELSK
jgi:hypothetical protein